MHKIHNLGTIYVFVLLVQITYIVCVSSGQSSVVSAICGQDDPYAAAVGLRVALDSLNS